MPHYCKSTAHYCSILSAQLLHGNSSAPVTPPLLQGGQKRKAALGRLRSLATIAPKRQLVTMSMLGCHDDMQTPETQHFLVPQATLPGFSAFNTAMSDCHSLSSGSPNRTLQPELIRALATRATTDGSSSLVYVRPPNLPPVICQRNTRSRLASLVRDLIHSSSRWPVSVIVDCTQRLSEIPSVSTSVFGCGFNRSMQHFTPNGCRLIA